jgi:hypothetical protein
MCHHNRTSEDVIRYHVLRLLKATDSPVVCSYFRREVVSANQALEKEAIKVKTIVLDK